MSDVIGIHHVAIAVPDIELAHRFSREFDGRMRLSFSGGKQRGGGQKQHGIPQLCALFYLVFDKVDRVISHQVI